MFDFIYEICCIPKKKKVTWIVGDGEVLDVPKKNKN